MRVWFVGVGEACDPAEINTSLAVEAGGTRLLLDCGFTAAAAYLRTVPRPERLDAVVLSHFHGDHFFGLPALLLQFEVNGRTAPLTIVGPEGLGRIVPAAMELAFGSLPGDLPFPLRLVEASAGMHLEEGSLALTFAAPEHSAPCLSVRVDAASGTLFYSGDGRPTPATLELARGAHIVVHESFERSGTTPGHGSIASSLAFARAAGASHFAAVHLRRELRRDQAGIIRAELAAATGLHAWLPASGEAWPPE
jgi:ribonuclease BN (tRNA processing enzyme)